MPGTNIKALSTSATVREVDENGLALSAVCTGTPPTTASTYLPGCLITATDTGIVYVNGGTTAAPVWAAVGSAASPQAAQVSLSSAQILALNATPVTLVAAPGSGKVIVVDRITLKMVTTATQYASGGALEFRYTDGSGAKVSADIAAAVVTAGAGTSYTSVAGVTTSLTNVANAPIVIDNATAAFTTGTGTGVVTVEYRIITP